MKIKKFTSLIIAVMVLVTGLFLAGCFKSKDKKVIECLNLTRSANSIEATLSGTAKMGGQAQDTKINMQVEDIHKDMKCKANIEMLGRKQEMYFSVSNGKVKVYLKDESGQYVTNSADSSELNEIDVTKNLDNYIQMIEKNPNIVTKINSSTYELNIPKEKISDIYSKVTGDASNMTLDSLKIEFVIGDDGYLQKANLKASSEGSSIEMNTDYSNYNKKFNIVMPSVSN